MKRNGVKWGSMLLAVMLSISIFSGCAQKPSGEAAKTTTQTQTQTPAKNYITLAMVSAWDTLVPFDTTSAYSDVISDLIFDKLVYLKADGTYYSRLAEKWEMSKDNTELTFYLNKKAKWHDGQPVTAKDVVFTSKLYAAPKVAAPRANNLSAIKGFGKDNDSLQVTAIDDYTVKFTLAEPTNIDFLMFTKFRDLYILPNHLLGNLPLEKVRESDYWKKPIGSGPAIYESQISGERVEFKANKNYQLAVPKWDRFIVRVVPTANLLSGLMNGEIDILAGNVGTIQSSDWDLAKQQKNLTSASLESLGYQYMAINTSKDYLPAKVRQAINMAINRDQVVKGLLKGEGQAAFSPIPKKNKYYNPVVEVANDVEKAKALLAEAGWDPKRELILSVPTGNAVREQAAVLYQQDLAKIGVKVKIESADFTTHLNKVREGKYDLGLIGSSGSPDPSECVINFKPDHINNFAKLSSWDIYNTGAKGEVVFSADERKVAYNKYQELLKEQVPFAFLYFQNSLFSYNNRIEGVKGIEDFSQLNRSVWDWYVK